MTASILLRPQPLSSPAPSPIPSPSPVSTPLPGLQPDLSSSSSSSFASGSHLDLHRASSAPSTRRIRFAPLPEPDRDLLLELHDPSCDAPQPDTKSATHPVPSSDDAFVDLSPSISPDSTVSSARSTPTIRPSSNTPSKNTKKSNLKLFRPFAFFRRAEPSPPPLSQPASPLPSSRQASLSSLDRSSSSVLNIPSLQSPRLPRISEDILSFSRISLFRDRSGSSSSTRPPRPSSPPPKPSKSHHRSTSTGCGQATKPVDGNRDWGQGSTQPREPVTIAGSGPRKRRASSSATPGAGGGRHSSAVKMLSNGLPPRPSTAPSLGFAPPKRTVRMLNGRVYGAKRYAAQTLADPFSNVRDDPEFVEWGYGGMGSVSASAGIGNVMWKGLQRNEHGGALLAGSSFGSPSASVNPTTGVSGGRGSGARPTSPNVRRKMTDNVPECGMGNVGAGGGLDEDDGSGMAWVKRRRAEKEAKARLEKRKSSDSLDASMYASTASTTTSLTACTSGASTDLTTPTTTPLTSRSPSIMDLKLTSSPPSESHDHGGDPSCAVTEQQSSKSVAAPPTPPSMDEHEHHILTAVRLSPNLSSSSHKHERAPLSALESQATRSPDSSDEDEPKGGSDEEEEQDDDDERVQDVGRKTALGAGVEKISRHVDVVETR